MNQSDPLSLPEDRFQKHIRSGGEFKFFAVRVVLWVSKFKALRSIPVLKDFIVLIESLQTAYLVEFENGLLDPEISTSSDFLTKVNYQSNRSDFFDYVVIGSGPGAVSAVMAIPDSNLVLIVEKGTFPKTPLSFHHTLTHVKNDFQSSGQELILGNKFPLFAQASTLGGGSEVNSGLFHRLPNAKKIDFLDRLNVSNATWDSNEFYIENFLNIKKTDISLTDSLIHRGAKLLELESSNIPRWRKYNKDGTFEHFGMNELFWKEYFQKENVFVRLQTTAVRIGKFSNGLSISLQDSEGNYSTVFTKKIVLAGGAIETPFLLAKSNLISWTDTRFQWHPMYRTIVSTNKEDLGFGDIDPVQAWTSDFSLKFGSAVSTPGLLALGLNRWISNDEAECLRSYYVSFSSSGHGGLFPGTKLPWYRMSSLDKELAKIGRKKLANLVTAGGGMFANKVLPVSDKPSTVHIFGTLPANSRIFLPGTCQLKNNPDIQVCDGSLLPIGPGVNPQGVIMTTVRSLFKP
jgi:hypothetical protein